MSIPLHHTLLQLVRTAGLRALVPVALAGAQSQAQESIVVRGDGATCVDCRLRLTSLATLRVPDTASALVSPFTFQQDSRGWFYFNDPFGTPGLRVFDHDGRYVRTIGRRGQAPGEFLSVNAIVFTAGDSLHAYGNAHWLFDPAGRHVRTQSTPELMTVSRAIRLGDGARVVVGSINSAAAYGQTFHVLGPDGSVARSFGLPPRASSVGAWANQRAVAANGRDGFVASKVNQYELEFWTAGGQLQRVIRREADWFPPWRSWNSRSDLQPPPPRLMSLAVDDSGFVWTLTSVADEHWKPTAASGGEGSMPSVGDLAGRFDSIIEVLDPRAGRIVASGRFPEMLIAMTRAGVVFENVESAEGEVSVRVWRAEVARR